MPSPTFHPEALVEFRGFRASHPRALARALARVVRVASFGLRETGGVFGDLIVRPDLFAYFWTPLVLVYVAKGPDVGETDTTVILVVNNGKSRDISPHLDLIAKRRRQLGV